MDGVGLTLNDMRRMARWHGRVINPALASASASMVVARTVAKRKAEKRKADQKASKPAKDTVRAHLRASRSHL